MHQAEDCHLREDDYKLDKLGKAKDNYSIGFISSKKKNSLITHIQTSLNVI